MRPVRVLIVDDSAILRKLLSDLLASDAEIVVAGTAGNGRQALARILEIKPDLVTLDVDMPGMNGMEALVEIRKLYAKLPVIMFSALTERGATATLDALARGASDYVAKPSYRETRERARAGAEGIASKDQSFVRGARAAVTAQAGVHSRLGSSRAADRCDRHRHVDRRTRGAL